jgi:hypothetical protein
MNKNGLKALKSSENKCPLLAKYDANNALKIDNAKIIFYQPWAINHQNYTTFLLYSINNLSWTYHLCDSIVSYWHNHPKQPEHIVLGWQQLILNTVLKQSAGNPCLYICINKYICWLQPFVRLSTWSQKFILWSSTMQSNLTNIHHSIAIRQQI